MSFAGRRALARLELKLPYRDEAVAGARADFVAGVRTQLEGGVLGSLLHGPLPTALASTDRDVLAAQAAVSQLEAESLEREERAASRRAQLEEQRIASGVLASVSPAEGLRLSPSRPEDALVFHPGDALISPCEGPLCSVVVSASGRYVALAAGSEVVVCEALPAGFKRIASRRVSPANGLPISNLIAFDSDSDSSALLLVVGDTCLGWDPLQDTDDGDLLGDVCCESSRQGLFLRLQSETGHIEAMASARDTFAFAPQQLLLLATTCAVEVYDLQLFEMEGPVLLQSFELCGSLLDVAFGNHGELAIIAITGMRGTVELTAYNVSTAWCVATLRPGDAAGSGAALVYNESNALLALATVAGRVYLYDTTCIGPAVAMTDILSPELGGTDDVEGLGAPPPLAWCITEPLLAVGGREDAILVYRYLVFGCALELVAVLGILAASPVRTLAWAPELGSLIASTANVWCYWLMDERSPAAEPLCDPLGDDAGGEELGSKQLQRLALAAPVVGPVEEFALAADADVADLQPLFSEQEEESEVDEEEEGESF